MDRRAQLRQKVAQACRVLGGLDLTAGTLGHVSARVPGSDTILIRARGELDLGVRYVTPDEVIEVDLDGRAIGDEGAPPPFEVFIHTELYRARPEVQSVVHIHPPTVVLFTICDLPLLALYGAFNPEGVRILDGGVPTFDRSILIDTPELGHDLVHAMGGAETCLMRGHGITTAGGSVEEACLNAIYLNELATMNYRARLLGEPRPIAEEDRAILVARTKATARATPGVPPPRYAAQWRHYCAITGEQDLAHRYGLLPDPEGQR